MSVIYRGHKIDVMNAKGPSGYMMTYFSVLRVNDGYECVNNAAEVDPRRDMVKRLKARIDKELASDDPWGEKHLAVMEP